ncbi:helix-turn-helix transcriptional regulator [Dyadobacter sp. 3J3]|uniref:helix-turn-helix domain-containing protein n=1 Tax=Dyadobacter sp. 3J3 TaxID=2606600 RepID=UPI001358E400
MGMSSFGEYIRQLREETRMPLRKLAAIMDIDQSTLSKLERGERPVNRQVLPIIATTFHLDEKELIIKFMSHYVANQLVNELYAQDILSAACEEIKSLQARPVTF